MGFSCENKDDATIQFMRRISVEVRQPIAKVTMPLFRVTGTPCLCATSVLLKIRQKHFILTAAHVFDKWTTRPIPLNVTDGMNGHQLFPIGEVTLRRSPTKNPSNRFTDDPYDACVCDITKATADSIAAGGRFRFAELSEVEPWSEQDRRDWFMVFGYPGSLNLIQIGPNGLGSNACAFASFLYCGERGNVRWTDADRGVAILLDYGQSATENDEGLLISPPHPQGMSGSGIWKIADYGSDLNNLSLSSLKLVGIQSAVYEQEQVLRGTRIEHALGMIYRGHEDLRPEIDRHFGRDDCRRWLD